jgi:hypothetical protein
MSKIIFKKSTVAGRVPSTVDLDYGEVALNYQDGKLHFKKSNNQIAHFKGYSRTEIIASTTSTTLDLGDYDDFVITLTSNTTFTLTNINKKLGASGTIVIKQDATGGRTFTKAAEMKTPLGGAGIAQVTASNSLSVLSYYVVDANTVLINYIGNFA